MHRSRSRRDTDRVVVGTGPRVHLGISTCPNDTFAMAALLENRVDTAGLCWDIELLDIHQLNQRLAAGEFDVAKVSFAAAAKMASDFWVLPVGSALGFGVGPLLLSRDADAQPTSDRQLTLCPGDQTTAAFLFDLFYPHTTRVEHVVFSDIMPSLRAGQADFGVCIHEGRFTFAESGLHCVSDLGELWQQRTAAPLPLGGLVMRSDRPDELVSRVVGVIDESLARARRNPDSAMAAMRRYAAELSDDVVLAHVGLYVNDWTVDLGTVGEDSLRRFATLATDSGWAEPGTTLRIFARS